MRIDIVTLFPELFEQFLRTSLIGRATTQQIAEVTLWQLREFGLGKHKNVDDTPYGGGSGMVLRVDVLLACLEAVDGATAPAPPVDGAVAPAPPVDGAVAPAPPQSAESTLAPAHRILLTPQGQRFGQRDAERLAQLPRIALVCGRYEGFDERVRAHVHEELSLGDFVMTGGEVAAMAVLEATVRLLPGVLGNAESACEESHSAAGGLEYPHYTRPLEFRGERVPEVLAGGNHAAITSWRRAQALARTTERRPDLLPKEPVR